MEYTQVVRPPVGWQGAEKFVLAVYHVAWTYDTVGHKLMYAKPLSRLPQCPPCGRLTNLSVTSPRPAAEGSDAPSPGPGHPG